MLALHMIANSLMLVNLGHDEAAAGSATTTIQALLMGTAIGAIAATGLLMGPPMGKGNIEEAGNIAKVSLVGSTGLGLITAILSAGLIPWVARPVFGSGPGGAAAKYFLIYSTGTIPALLLGSVNQVAFQGGHWFSPVTSNIAFRVPAVLISYALGLHTSLGVYGIALGSTISAWFNLFAFYIWMRTKVNLESMKIWQRPISDLSGILKRFSKTGSEMAFQRLTEWINLVILTGLVSWFSQNALVSLNPSIQYLTLLNLGAQGAAAAIGMTGTKNKGAMTVALKKYQSQNYDTAAALEYKEAHNNNVKTVVRGIVSSVILSAVLAVILCAVHRPAINIFMPSDEDSETSSLAWDLLLINAIGLPFDALRISSGGALRSWGIIMLANWISLITMTLLAVPVGLAIGLTSGYDVRPFFIARDVGIFFAAVMQMVVLFRCIWKDAKAIPNLNQIQEIAHAEEVGLGGDDNDPIEPLFPPRQRLGIQ